MTLVAAAPSLQTDDEITAALRRITPNQRRTMTRLEALPKWLYSDARYYARLDRYDREAQRAYFATINRVTTYTGPDYRVRFRGQLRFIRANQWQYDQALGLGMERSIGVPDLDDLKALTA